MPSSPTPPRWRGRIRRYYGRDSEVVHPPVDIAPFAADLPREDYLLVVARLFPYKRVDLAIEAANRPAMRLKVVGEGSDRRRLEALAGDTVEFVGWADDAEKARLYGSAQALLMPQEEDFGMVMVEALASGTPVVALRAGGALDIVEDGETGVFFDRQTPEDLRAAIERLERLDLDRGRLRERARDFSPERFDAAMRSVAERARQPVSDQVRALQRGGLPLDREPLERQAPAGGADHAATLRVRVQLEDRVGKGAGIAGGNEHPGAAGELLGDAVDSRAHHRDARNHRLEHGEREGIRTRGHREDIEARELLARVDASRVGDPERVELREQAGGELAVEGVVRSAGDPERDVRGLGSNQARRLDEDVRSLPRRDHSDRSDDGPRPTRAAAAALPSSAPS